MSTSSSDQDGEEEALAAGNTAIEPTGVGKTRTSPRKHTTTTAAAAAKKSGPSPRKALLSGMRGRGKQPTPPDDGPAKVCRSTSLCVLCVSCVGCIVCVCVRFSICCTCQCMIYT